MTPEARREAGWEDAVQLLRRRGYLRRRGDRSFSVRERTLPAILVLCGAVLLDLSAAMGGIVPTALRTVLPVALLLLPIVLFLTVTGTWAAAWIADRLHRAGHPVERVAGGAAVLSGVVSSALWLAIVAPPRPTRFSAPLGAAGGLALVGEALLMAGLARLIVMRLLKRGAPRIGAGPKLRTVVGVSLLGLSVAAALLAAPGRARRTGGSPEPVRVRPSKARLAVVAVDGPSPREMLLLANTSPELAELSGWTRAPLADSSLSEELPVRWIGIATGVAAARHGVTTLRQLHIRGFAGDVLPSRGLRWLVRGTWARFGVVQERTVPAALRRAATLWEMTSRAGVPIRVLGWWGSFPPRRVRGLVASERWLLTGERSAETLFPMSGVASLPSAAGSTPIAIDRRAVDAVERTDPDQASLVMAYLPGWWLEQHERREPVLLEAKTLRRHLDLLGEAIGALRAKGYAVCVIGLAPGRPGWVMWSSGRGSAVPAITPRDLLATCLDALGLPPAAAIGGRIRRDLSGVAGRPVERAMAYGPPPPLASKTAQREGAAQLELLRNLGYLQ